MRTNLLFVLTSLTLLQSACIFGARTPINDGRDDNNPNDVICIRGPVCPENFSEVSACPPDGRKCKRVTECGATISCVADDICLDEPKAMPSPSCPPEYTQVERCAPGADCKRVEGSCGEFTLCQREQECPIGAAFTCPDDYLPVERCDEDLETCLVTRSCGQTLYCQYNPATCDAIPVCPEGSSPVSCADPDRGGEQCSECADGSCFSESICGSTITCKKSDCSPMDAKAQGDCRAVLGYSWNGQSCEMLAGCECVGSACDNLYQDEETCKRGNLFCQEPMLSCEAKNNAYFPLEVATIGGYAWDGRQCVGLLGQGPCQGPDCPYVSDTLEQCQQTFAHCQDNTCKAQDAQGVGACLAYFGVKFDGRACVGIGGCSCQGADCDKLYTDEASCERDNNPCLQNSCEPQDARGVGLCDAEFGAAFDGNTCRTLSGCECVGADCDKVFADVESCKNATLQCAP